MTSVCIIKVKMRSKNQFLCPKWHMKYWEHGGDPSIIAALKCKRANQSVAFASSDRGLTTTGCAPLKLMQSFQIFVIFRLVLWISSSLWLNVVSGALLKVMLIIQRGFRSLPFQNQMGLHPRLNLLTVQKAQLRLLRYLQKPFYVVISGY